MANILNIDTSSTFCSIALSQDGETVFGIESSVEMDHSKSLAGFVEKALNKLEELNQKLDAVAVIYGPGSYTGLRIGLSLSKGLCYALDIPMIVISSLELMAVRAMFSLSDILGEEIIVPMLDAGRMEVYTSIVDCSLNKIMDDQPLILDNDSFSFLKEKKRVIFVGEGSLKYRELYSFGNAYWAGALSPHAKYMAPLSEKLWRNSAFADTAYATPRYLKEYQATISKNKL